MNLPKQALEKCEELALDYMTNHGTLPIEKSDEQERQSFSVGFEAGYLYGQKAERERARVLTVALQEISYWLNRMSGLRWKDTSYAPRFKESYKRSQEALDQYLKQAGDE